MDIRFDGKRALVTGAGKGTVLMANGSLTPDIETLGKLLTKIKSIIVPEDYVNVVKPQMFERKEMMGRSRQATSTPLRATLTVTFRRTLKLQTSGIGRCVALKLAQCGAKVVAISRTKEDLDTLKKEVPSIETHTLDLADWDATRKLVQSLAPIDLLVNNAGTLIMKPFLDVTRKELDTVFELNFDSVFNVTQLVAKDMVDRKKGGAIVMMSSTLSFKVADQHTVYCSTKAALDQFTRCLAVELGPHKIRVNAVNPTLTLTRLTEEVYGLGDPKIAQPFIDRNPLKRLGEVEDMANATLFLLSDKADMINGLIMPVDGGVTV